VTTLTNARGYVPRAETPRYAQAVPASLTWHPPGFSAFAGYTTIHVTNVSNRVLNLTAGRDYVVVLDEKINTLDGTGFGGLSVQGGRNVVLIGGEIEVPLRASGVTLTSALAAGATTISVSDASGFDASGKVRVRGDSWTYTAKSGNTLTGASSDGATFGSSPTHPIGSAVYPHEHARMGLFCIGQTGTLHIEGLKIDGADASEGIQFFASGTGAILQVQNCQIGPLVVRDVPGATDNHADVVQILSGASEVRIDRLSAESAYQGLLNFGSSGLRATGLVDIRHSDFIGTQVSGGAPLGYVINDSDVTNVSVTNVWSDPGPRRPDLKCTRYDAPALMRAIQFGRPAQRFCTTAGISYVSPGYA
jgi:hypothetical protein